METEKTLSSILKEINKKFNNVASIGVPALRDRGVISFGTPSLDFCTYDSMVEGSFIELNGLESSGKTTIAYAIAANYIKREMQKRPDNPRYILYCDVEATADKDWALKSTGYDMNSKDVPTIYITNSGQSAEEWLDSVIDFVSTGEIGLVIFDSLTMLVGQQVQGESLEKVQMGGASTPIGNFCKRATGIFNRNRCTFIGIQGLTENLTGYGDQYLVPGGKTWKRSCSQRIRVKKGNFFDDEGNVLTKKDAQSPAGHVIEIYIEKTKTCRWNRKLGTTNLNYSTGLDKIQDTIDVAIILGLIDNQTQGYFKVLDVDTGEALKDRDGNEVKIRGKKNLKPYFEEHPDIFRSLYDKCYEEIRKTEDSSIISFEQLLNVDVDEVIGNDTE